MFKRLPTEKIVSYGLLAFFLALVIVFGLSSYSAGLGSDPYGIVHFAEHLARGKLFSDYPVYNWIQPDWNVNRTYFVLHGNYLLSPGKMYCKYAIGFPLFLAVFIKLFGLVSIYYVNILVLVLLLWFSFLLARLILAGRDNSMLLALLIPLFLIVLINQVWALALRPSRDLSALLFLIVGLFLGIKSLVRLPRINYLFLMLGSFCLGYSASIRLPNLLAGFPAALYLFARLKGRVKWSRLAGVILLSSFCFVLALGPVFWQNYQTGGSPFKPPRPEIVGRNPLKVAGEFNPPPLWLGFFRTTAPRTLDFFWRLYGPFFTVLILIGVVAGWRTPEIRYLCLGIPLVFILFYSMWVHLMTRYMLITQPFLILLAVSGIDRFFRMKRRKWILWTGAVLIALDTFLRWRWRYAFGMQNLNVPVCIFAVSFWFLAGWAGKLWPSRRRLAILILVLLGLFLGKLGPVWFHSKNLFQLPQARRFGRDINRLVEPGSLIFATKPISGYISLFSDSYSIRPFEMGRVGVEGPDGLKRLLKQGVALYLLDNSGWKRDATKAIPLFRQFYDLLPVGKLPGDRYNLAGKFGKPVCTLYRIEPWSRNEVKLKLPHPAGGGGALLMLNLERIWDEPEGRRSIEFVLNGHKLEHRLKNGINFLFLPAGLLATPSSSLQISSDQPLPRQLHFRLRNIYSDYRLDLANQLTFPNKSLTDRFTEARLRDQALVRLGWNKPGLLIIPTVVINGTELVGELKLRRVKDFSQPLYLRVSLNGKVIADRRLGRKVAWKKISFLLPAAAIDSVQSRLELEAHTDPGLAISAGDRNSRALLFEAVTISRWRDELELSTPRKNHYFLAFDPGQLWLHPGPFQIQLNGETVKDGTGDGVERLILPPGLVTPPASRLTALSGKEEKRLFLPARYLLWGGDSELVIDLGGPADGFFIESGFHAPEQFRGKTPVRWTKETARLIIPVIPRKGESIELSLKLVDGGPPRFSRPSEMKIDLDGRRVGVIPLRRGEGVYHFTIKDPGRTARLGRLSLIVPTWQPSVYFHTADTRKLGVRLDWVRLGYSPK